MTSGPAISVTGVKAAHANRAIRWLRNRSLLSFYRKDDKSLNAFVTKFGEESTEKILRQAIEETR
jgi:hypothetical protein